MEFVVFLRWTHLTFNFFSNCNTTMARCRLVSNCFNPFQQVQGVLDAVATRPEVSDLHQDNVVLSGKTMAADCFYEGQGRLDGAICEYNNDDKMAFLKQAHDAGVRNIEMESLQFGAFTHKLGIRATACCVTLLNRLEGDQVRSTPEELHAMDQRPGRVALAYIKSELNMPPPKKTEYKMNWTVAAH